ncbi:MAG: PAS domain S-box protein, partial [Candidatus Dadabacteria bacterium]
MSTPKNRYIQTVSNFSLKRLFQQLISKVREFFLKAASLAVSDSKSSLDFTQNRWHSLVVENLTAAVIVQDLGGKVLFCNGYAEVLTGYSKREIYGTTNDFLHFIIPYEEDRKRYQRGKTFAKAGEPFQVRYRIKHKAGVEIWAESRTVPIQNKQGEVEAVLSIIFDITASVRYQQLVEEKNRDLYDFAYMVSHDLRSPLSTLKGMVEIINSSKENVEEVKEAVMYISKATQRLDTLISRILDYAKVSSASS